MKHQPITTEADDILDLSKPSLEGLAFLLRHQELWPKGFVWNYADCSKCAMGMAHDLWAVAKPTLGEGADIMSAAFGLPYSEAHQIFLAASGRPFTFDVGSDGVVTCAITPEMVADDIEAHLARSPSFGRV